VRIVSRLRGIYRIVDLALRLLDQRTAFVVLNLDARVSVVRRIRAPPSVVSTLITATATHKRDHCQGQKLGTNRGGDGDKE
jgi:hypothetical protein